MWWNLESDGDNFKFVLMPGVFNGKCCLHPTDRRWISTLSRKSGKLFEMRTNDSIRRILEGVLGVVYAFGSAVDSRQSAETECGIEVAFCG